MASAAICERCGESALGYATINRKRYCHSDERSCYAQESSDRVLNIAAENAVRWADALKLLGRDHG